MVEHNNGRTNNRPGSRGTLELGLTVYILASKQTTVTGRTEEF